MTTAIIIILSAFILHWYASLFFQSFFNHRYAAHGMFTMSKGWEKVFHVMSFISNGSSYLSPNTYGIMHRLHHAYADTEKDPHSPKYDKNFFSMMWRTRRIYLDIGKGKYPLEERFKKGVPGWKAFDKFAESRITRVAWIVVYILFYIFVAKGHWYLYMLIPIHAVMGPFHGVIINWFAHKYGYVNFKLKDTSKNIMPVDIFMLGEGFHNNHHKFGGRANFGVKWFEFDPVYPFIWLFDKLNIIQLDKKRKPEAPF